MERWGPLLLVSLVILLISQLVHWLLRKVVIRLAAWSGILVLWRGPGAGWRSSS